MHWYHRQSPEVRREAREWYSRHLEREAKRDARLELLCELLSASLGLRGPRHVLPHRNKPPGPTEGGS